MLISEETKLLQYGVLSLIGEMQLEYFSDLCAKFRDAVGFAMERDLLASVFIQSSGGDLRLFWALRGVFHAYKKVSTSGKIETIVGSKGAHSAAAMTFLTGENRVIHERACLLFHYASCEELSKLKESELSLERVNSLMLSYFCRRTGIEKRFAQKLFLDDRMMSAEEALELGIATEIMKQPTNT